MEGVGSQAHRVQPGQARLGRRADRPESCECAGRGMVGGVKLNPQMKRPVPERILDGTQVDLPLPRIARSDKLVFGLDLFADLLAHFGQIDVGHRAFLQSLLELALGFLLDERVEILRFG